MNPVGEYEKLAKEFISRDPEAQKILQEARRRLETRTATKPIKVRGRPVPMRASALKEAIEEMSDDDRIELTENPVSEMVMTHIVNKGGGSIGIICNESEQIVHYVAVVQANPTMWIDAYGLQTELDIEKYPFLAEETGTLNLRTLHNYLELDKYENLDDHSLSDEELSGIYDHVGAAVLNKNPLDTRPLYP